MVRSVILGAALCSSLGVANAEAATITVGSPLATFFSPAEVGAHGTIVNSALPEFANVVSPVTGTIVRWRMTGASGGPFELRVLTPDGGATYTGAGTSAPETPSSTATQTFATSMPISAGQTIGLDNANATDMIGVARVAAADYSFWIPPLADGATLADSGSNPGNEVGFNADVRPVPTVSSVSPSSGPPSGGTAVTITGSNFTGTTAVSFGSTPAASFTVVSDTTITAVAPPGSGPVDVTARNPGQSAAVATDKFTYIPRPAVSLVSPASGLSTGGTTVMIVGSGFSSATAVSFGPTPAVSFTVNSDSSITAVSPASSVGTVHVTITTSGGTSPTTAADDFRFKPACIVPKLKGKTPKAARKALKKVHCALGNVKGPKGKTARVGKQKPKPGKILPAGSKVAVTMKV